MISNVKYTEYLNLLKQILGQNDKIQYIILNFPWLLEIFSVENE